MKIITRTDTIKIIEEEDILALIDAAVEKRGEDWVYPDTGSCRYVYDPTWYEEAGSGEARQMVAYFGEDVQPACLIGQVLYDLDPLFLEPLTEHNDESVEGWMNDGGLEYAVVEVGDVTYKFSHEVVQLMQTAQSVQDSGQSWGTARNRAHARVHPGL